MRWTTLRTLARSVLNYTETHFQTLEENLRTKLYIVYTNFTQLPIKMPADQTDITSCEQLAKALSDQGRNHEAASVQKAVTTSKQAILQVTMECVKPINNM